MTARRKKETEASSPTAPKSKKTRPKKEEPKKQEPERWVLPTMQALIREADYIKGRNPQPSTTFSVDGGPEVLPERVQMAKYGDDGWILFHESGGHLAYLSGAISLVPEKPSS